MTNTAPTAEATQDTSGQDVTLNADDVAYLLSMLNDQHDTIGKLHRTGEVNHAEACIMDERLHEVQAKLEALAKGGTFAVVPF